MNIDSPYGSSATSTIHKAVSTAAISIVFVNQRLSSAPEAGPVEKGEAMKNSVRLPSRRVVPRRRKLATAAALGSTLLMVAEPIAIADPQVMPFKQQQYVTADGWTVDITLSNEIIDHIDNLAGASNSWQARVSLRAEANITGSGSSPIQDGQLESGYFVGCRTDSSPGVELGGGIGGGAQISEFGGIAGGAGFGGAIASQGIAGGGTLRVLLKPGGLAQVPIDRINLRDTNVISEFNNQNLEADGCGGQVKIQSYATIKIRTKRGNNTQTIYGDPKDL